MRLGTTILKRLRSRPPLFRVLPVQAKARSLLESLWSRIQHKWYTTSTKVLLLWSSWHSILSDLQQGEDKIRYTHRPWRYFDWALAHAFLLYFILVQFLSVSEAPPPAAFGQLKQQARKEGSLSLSRLKGHSTGTSFASDFAFPSQPLYLSNQVFRSFCFAYYSRFPSKKTRKFLPFIEPRNTQSSPSLSQIRSNKGVGFP